MAGYITDGACYGRVLESHHCLAEGLVPISSMHSEIPNVFVVALNMEVLPPMGSIRWGGAFGEYSPVYGEQLFRSWVLEELASKLLSMAYPVGNLLFGLYSAST